MKNIQLKKEIGQLNQNVKATEKIQEKIEKRFENIKLQNTDRLDRHLEEKTMLEMKLQKADDLQCNLIKEIETKEEVIADLNF